MPPKVKITKEAIIQSSIEEIREHGWRALNARSIANRLGCSTQPIFRVFKTMEELKKSVWNQVENDYNEYMLNKMQLGNRGFLELGIAYIQYASIESNLFQYLFMSGALQIKSVMDMVNSDDEKPICELLMRQTGLSQESVLQLYADVWLVTHGIASVTATNGCKFTEEEVCRILGDVYWGTVSEIKKREEANHE